VAGPPDAAPGPPAVRPVPPPVPPPGARCGPERLQARLRSVQSRRRFLLRELDAVRRRAERLEEIVVGAVEERVPWERAYMRLDR